MTGIVAEMSLNGWHPGAIDVRVETEGKRSARFTLDAEVAGELRVGQIVTLVILTNADGAKSLNGSVPTG